MQTTQQDDSKARWTELGACEDRVDAINDRLLCIESLKTRNGVHLATNDRTYASLTNNGRDCHYARLSLPGLNNERSRLLKTREALTAETVALLTERRALREALSDLR